MLTFHVSETGETSKQQALESFIALTHNPAHFPAVYDMDAALRQTNLADISVEYLKSQPPMMDLIRDRYLVPSPSIVQLLTYPKNSLAYVYASHLQSNGFEPDFYRIIPVETDAAYLNLRRSQTHDIHHVITGFGTDLAGEIGLQAFQLAQMRSPLAIALMMSAIVTTIADTTELSRIMAAIHQGWEMGQQAQPLLAQKWEEQWEKPLAQWQRELNVRPVSQASPSFPIAA